MLAKKSSYQPTSSQPFRRELKYLYARRMAIDTLIHSLEEYDRFRARASAPHTSKRKSA